MDLLHFLTDRTHFIRTFFDNANAPFVETRRRIEAEEPPFVPPYSEDGEPPFLSEWLEAQTGSEVLGLACVSLLSESLKLYFQSWESELGISCEKVIRKEKLGFLHGYLVCFEKCLGLSWDKAGVDLDLLEQVILARNNARHPDAIETIAVRNPERLRRDGRAIFFASEAELEMLKGAEGLPFMQPSLIVTRENLWEAIGAVEQLAARLEAPLLAKRYPHRQRESDERP